MKKTLEERYWEKVDKNGAWVLDTQCWDWKGANNQGYGFLSLENRIKEWNGTKYKTSRIKRTTLYANRLSYEIHNKLKIDEIDSDVRLVVRHKCDNPPCTNPDHLVLGSYADNNRDMRERDRGPSILSNAQVNDIRLRSAKGEYIQNIQKEYNIDRDILIRVITGKSFKQCSTPPAEIYEAPKSNSEKYFSRLTLEQVIEIWKWKSKRYHGLQKILAERYGVSNVAISQIWHKKYAVQKERPELFQ